MDGVGSGSPTLREATWNGSRRLLRNHDTLYLYVQQVASIGATIALLYAIVRLLGGEFDARYQLLAIATAALMGVTYSAVGVYRRFTGGISPVLSLTRAWLITLGCLLGLAYVSKWRPVGIREVALSWAIAALVAQYLVYLALYGLSRLMQRRLNVKLSTVMLGSGELAAHLTRSINHNPFLPDQVVGVLDTPENLSRWHVESVPALGGLEQLDEVMKAGVIDRVYIALPVERSAEIRELQRRLNEYTVDVIWAPDIFAFNLLNHSVREVSGAPLISLSESPLVMGGRAFVKALMDVTVALAMMVVLSPLLIATAVAIKLTSRGPVLFKQSRLGWDGSVFKLWKFRSMVVELEAPGDEHQTQRNDPRITSVGRVIRRFSIDELPQLINVLSGSMSLVGPRPHSIEHNYEYACQLDNYMSRHRIKPGLTGWAQIHGCRGATRSLDKMRERVQYDLEYINNWSLKLDVWILLCTPASLVRHEAY